MMGGNQSKPAAPTKPPPLGPIPDPSKSPEALTAPLPALPARAWQRLPGVGMRVSDRALARAHNLSRCSSMRLSGELHRGDLQCHGRHLVSAP